jgi:FkbM family methyltransferase
LDRYDRNRTLKGLHGLQRLVRGLGLEVRRASPNDIDSRRLQMIRAANVRLLVDVGANDGPYALYLRKTGYDGAIISFEPLPDAYSRLEARSSSDPAWECHNLALGQTDGVAKLHVAGNSTSSSLLPMTERHLQSSRESAYVRDQEATVTSLDSFFADHLATSGPAYLKLDVQGFEMAVLRGAEVCLAQVPLIEIELSVVPLYEGQSLYREVLDYLGARGYEIAALSEVFVDPRSGGLLQFDAILSRQNVGAA